MNAASTAAPVAASGRDNWPPLPLEAWNETYATLQLWTQIVGKVRMALSAPINHWWHSTLYVTRRGFSTSLIPYGASAFEIEFDFCRHQLRLETSTGDSRSFPLISQSVSEFYAQLMEALRELGVEARITPIPNEVSEPIPFPEDRIHSTYDPEYARRHWQVLLQADRVLKEFRGRFLGKCSPVHFFWGSFDLAVTRFSGRRAPEHPGGVPNLPDWVTREAYSHEVSSCGFWPGGGPVPYPAFYSYAYPSPPDFKEVATLPEGAFFSEPLGEFILPYDLVRQSSEPDTLVLAFLQSTYEAAARLLQWDRSALERTEEEVSEMESSF